MAYVPVMRMGVRGKKWLSALTVSMGDAVWYCVSLGKDSNTSL